MSSKEKRACPVCGTLLSDNSETCPVCALRGALGKDQVTSDLPVERPHLPSQFQFEHYEILTREDGTPVELGRGAMGVTYKAIDVNLRCVVALKVINARFIGDESARRRFVREARAAASVRHPNVASVFYLGISGDSYFYAMEFVDGESLDRLIRRHSGRLALKLALEIMTQVASGLTAVHKQKLVHRDIKPSNIMVALEGNGTTAKIIDLGLAKGVAGSQFESAVSVPGSFAGTPEFASPEQFAGVGVDIRSDLYSLGVMLWNMLAGRTPFRGAPGELMHHHLHSPLPVGQLDRIQQPVVALLEVLLEKDPARRFQSPMELLNAMRVITGAIDAGRTVSHQSLRQQPLADLTRTTRKPSTRRGPERISVARLPVTGSQVFGREDDLAFLDAAWAEPLVNVVTVVAWAGVGKSTLVNRWLQRMAAERYRGAEIVFGWSFYRQSTTGSAASSADEFLDASLGWFGDPDPRTGTAWDKGERLARLIARRRILLVLDGLEPLQNPPGPQEGRLREAPLQALLRELAAFNRGLCLITTRVPVADLADHEGTSVLRRELEHLSNEAGAQLLRALGVKGYDTELRSASDEFRGHCLALTLLGSYLNEAYNGDIRCRNEVSERLAHDVRQGVHARKVMESYQTWFGEGPEVSLLRMLGLFDRPADEKAFGALLKPPAIRGLTDSLADLSPAEWRTIFTRLRRARLLAGEDPHNPTHLDTHPLVREYYGEQLRHQRREAWKKSNRRLYNHYRSVAPQLPDSFREMEPLFLAVTCGCQADLYRDALNEVYIPRIQRGNLSFAAKVLGVRGALLSVLVHFFEHGRWGSLVQRGAKRQSLTAEDQLFVLMQAAMYLTATRGFSAREALICYERAQSLCESLNRPVDLYVTLMGQWRHSNTTDNLSVALKIAKRIYARARQQNEPALMIGGYTALSCTLCFLGDFRTSGIYAVRGVRLWHSRGVQSPVEEVDVAAVSLLCYQAQSEWHRGDIASSQTNLAEATALAKEMNDMHGLAISLWHEAVFAYYADNPAEVERSASDSIELSTRHHFAHWLPQAEALYGWARAASGDVAEGISRIVKGLQDFRAIGALRGVPFFLALKAEALFFAQRMPDALEAIREAQILVERSEEHWWSAELHRLRGLFLANIGAEETQIEASFREAIRIAREQKSTSLAKRAEATYTEYRRQKASASGGRGIRLPIC